MFSIKLQLQSVVVVVIAGLSEEQVFALMVNGKFGCLCLVMEKLTYLVLEVFKVRRLLLSQSKTTFRPYSAAN